MRTAFSRLTILGLVAALAGTSAAYASPDDDDDKGDHEEEKEDKKCGHSSGHENRCQDQRLWMLALLNCERGPNLCDLTKENIKAVKNFVFSELLVSPNEEVEKQLHELATKINEVFSKGNSYEALPLLLQMHGLVVGRSSCSSLSRGDKGAAVDMGRSITAAEQAAIEAAARSKGMPNPVLR